VQITVDNLVIKLSSKTIIYKKTLSVIPLIFIGLQWNIIILTGLKKGDFMFEPMSFFHAAVAVGLIYMIITAMFLSIQVILKQELAG